MDNPQEKYAALVESAPDGIIVVDHRGRISLVNKQTENLFGYTRDELIGQSVELLVPERARERHPRLRDSYWARPTVRPMGAGLDLTGRRKDGTEFPVDISLSPIETDEGRLVSAAVRDATERKKAEAKFAALLEAAPDAIVVVDEHGVIQIVNHQTEALFGFARAELIGTSIDVLLPARSRDRHPMLRQGFFASPMARPMGAGLQLWARRKDGTEFPVDIALAPLETEEGVLVSAAVRDITERLRVQDVLREAKEEAERANAAKSEFLSRMSHELRTPLSAILGFSELMQMHEVSPEQRAVFMERTHKAGLHLLSLINDVLDISRVESGTLSVSIEPTMIRPVLDDALEIVQSMAAQRGITVSSEVDGTESLVMADANRLKQVMLNLLSNAVKYNRDRGSVAVSCERRDDRLRIVVADTGPGIAGESMSKLFQPFERLGAERGTVEGTGIGLALSSRLVELMRGAIGVESAPGKGSSFWVELPIAVDVPPEMVESVGPPPEALDGERTFTVVYIEDNLSNFMVVEGVLALRPNVRVMPAIQGSLGLDLAREHKPDLILLDLNLPDIPGEEVLRRLRSDLATAAIPVVVVSADAMPGRRQQMIHLGAQAYITKPLDIRSFLLVLDEFIAKSRLT